jgi:hypothetical protein
MVADLELVQAAEGPSMCECLYGPTTDRGKKVVRHAASLYTTDVNFLRDTVKWIAKDRFQPFDTDPFAEVWKKHHETTEFNTLYHYIEHEKLEFLNKVPIVLLILSIYSITSPVMFLLSPLFILIFPFVMLNMTGRKVDWSSYKNTLYDVLKKHALGGLILGLKEANANQIVTGLLTAGLFGVQVYSNVQSCIQFYKSLATVHHMLETTQAYIEHCSLMMLAVKESAPKTYQNFADEVETNRVVLSEILKKLQQIKRMSHSFGEVKQIGRMRHLFYELRHNKPWRAAIDYSLAFSGYTETILHLHGMLHKKAIAPCAFGKKKDKMVSAYYPPNPDNKRHTYNVKNFMITGPNASGKTTFIKSAMLNVLFSQQIGCGFYKRFYMKTPYRHLFCYLNIPDTSGRDSLFQAEARRCKEVLDEVSKGEKTLCIFDELFSGTNPSEASASAYAFLKHLRTLPNVTFLLTTHFLDVCDRLENEVQNAHMTTTKTTSGDLIYTYKFSMGVSKIKGALKVLKDLNYPTSILDCAQNFL